MPDELRVVHVETRTRNMAGSPLLDAVVRLLLSTLAVYIAARILPGVSVDGTMTAVTVAVVLGLVNAVVKPLLIFLTLPVTLLTFGLFLLVINAAMVELADWLVPGFQVDGFWWALLFSLVVSFVGWFLNAIAGES